jgi:hypothetical protein
MVSRAARQAAAANLSASLVDYLMNVSQNKQVELGDLRDGLRVIRSGLAPTDKIIIDGIPAVAPGAKVSPHDGSIRFASQQSEK